MNNRVVSILAFGFSGVMFTLPSLAAKYQVVDQGNLPSHKYTYGQAVSQDGKLIIAATERYNLPIMYSYLSDNDFIDVLNTATNNHSLTTELDNIQDFEALKAGNPSANDFSWLLSFVKSKSTNVLYQKFASTNSFVIEDQTTREITAFDEKFSENGEFTRSSNSIVRGFNDNGWLFGFGNAPSLPSEFTNSSDVTFTYWNQGFTARGFVSPDGQTIKAVLPPEVEYGGVSVVYSVNENNVAVGYASVAKVASVDELIKNEDGGCSDPDVLLNTPFEVCVASRVTGLYYLHAYKWQLDSNGNVISGEDLGLALTPAPDETDLRRHESVAFAVNNAGVAVGSSVAWIDYKSTIATDNQYVRSYAAVFKDGQVIDFSDHKVHTSSQAVDINEQGIAVGHMKSYINGSERAKFFHVDTNADVLVPEFPDDFFKGASSNARAINDNGLIVGDGEVETHNDQSAPRRRHGFLYDINTKTFTDLNAFLACDTAYTIIEAKDINNENQIAATALVESIKRDSFGQPILDSNGEQIKQSVVRAVLLNPTGGTVEDCSSESEKLERQGASFNFSALFLIPLLFVRRRFIKL